MAVHVNAGEFLGALRRPIRGFSLPGKKPLLYCHLPEYNVYFAHNSRITCFPGDPSRSVQFHWHGVRHEEESCA